MLNSADPSINNNFGDLPNDTLIMQIGAGFFERGVCAVEFSFDSRLLAGSLYLYIYIYIYIVLYITISIY